MIPGVAELFTSRISALRQATAGQLARIAQTPDDLLSRTIGIPDIELCRKIGTCSRIARRLDGLIAETVETEALEFERDREQRKAEEAIEIPVHPVPPEFGVISDRIAAAIMLASFGLLMDRSHIHLATKTFNQDAVAFGLEARAMVPGWMSAGAGRRVDVLRQFSATCIGALGQISVRYELPHLLPEIGIFDPILIDPSESREQAAALAEAAIDFQAYEPEDNDASRG